MEKENDIFDQPSKIQNMNYLFDEEEATRDLRNTTGEPPRQRPASASRKPRSSQGSQTASRPAQDRVQKLMTEESPDLTEEAVSGIQAEFATPYRQSQPRTARRVSESNRTQAARPRQAQPRRTRPEDGQQPRQAQPRQAQPRQAQPRQAQPRQAQPRQAQPRQAQAGQTRSGQARQRQTQPGQAQSGQYRPSDSGSRPRSNSANGSRPSGYSNDRRVNRSSAAPSRKRKKGSSGFKKFILIYSALLLVVLIVGTIVFSSFLNSLEKSQPSNIAAQVAESLSSGKAASYLESNEDLINSFGDPSDMISQFAQNVQGVEQLSYIENSDYRADAPSYNITSNGDTIAKITLEKTGSGSFGLSKWGIASIDIADYMDTQSFEFLAPLGTTITINGVELDEKYLTGKESIPENLSIAAKYVNIPSYLTYKVSGIPGNPQISAKDAAQNELALTSTADKYVAGTETTQEFIDSVDPLVNQTLENWGRHFINMGDNLSAYMIEGSDWYTYIFGGPDMDPIMTSFYEYESIADYEFTEKSTSNYIRYSDDCFSVDVHYKMRVDFNNDRMSDDNQQLDATWVFITQNNGQDWYLVDCIYK